MIRFLRNKKNWENVHFTVTNYGTLYSINSLAFQGSDDLYSNKRDASPVLTQICKITMKNVNEKDNESKESSQERDVILKDNY